MLENMSPGLHSATWFGTKVMPVLEVLAYWPHTNDSLGGRILQVKARRQGCYQNMRGLPPQGRF
jgi:hypothetical protein